MTQARAHAGGAVGDGAPLRLGVLAGSPRRGNCAHLAVDVVVPALRGELGECADVEARKLRSYGVAPCVGCGACERTGSCVLTSR